MKPPGARAAPGGDALQVLDISQWIKAFHLYIAIYIKARPQEAPYLLQYLMVVESIPKEKGDWRVHDEYFVSRGQSQRLVGRSSTMIFTLNVMQKAQIQ